MCCVSTIKTTLSKFFHIYRKVPQRYISQLNNSSCSNFHSSIFCSWPRFASCLYIELASKKVLYKAGSFLKLNFSVWSNNFEGNTNSRTVPVSWQHHSEPVFHLCVFWNMNSGEVISDICWVSSFQVLFVFSFQRPGKAFAFDFYNIRCFVCQY